MSGNTFLHHVLEAVVARFQLHSKMTSVDADTSAANVIKYFG